MILLVLAAAAAAAVQSFDAPPRTPSPAALAIALTGSSHKRVDAGDVRSIQCEGLFYDPQDDPSHSPPRYACRWDQQNGKDWRGYSSYFEFDDPRWKLTDKPVTDLPPDPASIEERRFREWLIPHLRHEAEEYEDRYKFAIRYGYTFVDLDGDGQPEALVWVNSDSNCGSGGCDLEIERQENGKWRTFSDAVRTRPPIEVLTTKHHGWHDLAVFDVGGGIMRGFESPVRFMGKEYDESPSDGPLRKGEHGRVVLTYEMANRPLY
jgi:hypothetical protein